MLPESVLKKKYTHGRNIVSTIRLYYEYGKRRKFVDIPASQSPWYFYISRADFRKHKTTFKAMKDQEQILGYKRFREFYQIFCKNRNIPQWRMDEYGDFDQKAEVLAVTRSLGITDYEADVSSLDRFLIDNNVEMEDDPYIGYFDIETDDRKNTFAIGAQRILSMAVTSNRGETWYVTSRNEEKLLEKMVKLLRRFTIIVGYNSEKFDLPYIKARSDIYGIEFETDDMIHIDFWERIKTLYRYDKEGPSNFKLDTVAMHFLGEEKYKWDNNNGFYWNWRKNHSQFKKYNILDVKLLRKLDVRLEILKTMQIQCGLCGIFLNRFWNTRLTDMYLLRQAKRSGVAMPTQREHIKLDMPGGRVHTPRPGIVDNCEVWDFSQMYSTIMRSLQISPETYRLLSHKEAIGFNYTDWIISPVTSAVKLFFSLVRKHCDGLGIDYCEIDHWSHLCIYGVDAATHARLLKIVKDDIDKFLTLKKLDILGHFVKTQQFNFDGETYDISMIYDRQPVFKKRPKSLVAKMLDTFVAKRDEAKAMMKKFKEGSPDWKLWNAYNLAYKLMGNVVFGYMASSKSRCYSHPMACSITLAGQTIINLVKKGVKKEFGLETVYSDTDSVFLKHPKHPKNLDKFRKKFLAWFDEYLTGALRFYFNADTHCMGLEPKVLYDRLLLIAKKTYIGKYQEDDEIKYDSMGIDFVKRSTIPYTKVLQEKLIKSLIRNPKLVTEEKLRAWALKEKDRFDALEITNENVGEFAISTRVEKHPDQYSTDLAHVNIVKKMLADGEQFFIGGVLQWVIIETPKKKQVGEALHRFKANPDLKLDKARYWSAQIYSKLKRVFEALHPDVVWESLDPIEEAKRTRRMENYKKALQDPNRKQRCFRDMIGNKSMHPADKRLMLRWCREQGIDVHRLAEEVGIKNLQDYTREP